jgi:hypothetical protein
VQELVRARAECRFTQPRILAGGEDNDGAGSSRDDALQRCEAGGIRQPEVGKDQLEGARAQQLQRLLQAFRSLQRRTSGQARDRAAHERSEVGIVLDQQDAHRTGGVLELRGGLHREG